MQILRELVTVIQVPDPICHWETGKADPTDADQPGDLPFAVQGYRTQQVVHLPPEGWFEIPDHEELVVRTDEKKAVNPWWNGFFSLIKLLANSQKGGNL